MKKLMIAAAIVCAAAMSQAASVAWGNTSTSKITDLTGAAMTSGNADKYKLSFQLMMVGEDSDSSVAQTGKISSMTAGVMDSSNNATKWSYTYGDDASNGDLFYILATMTVDGKDYQMKIDNAGSNWAIAATDSTGKDEFTWAAGTYGGLGTEGQTGKWVAQSVPEPTSGLLLLLGMAGLALRRGRRS